MFGSDAPLGRFGGNGENGISPQKAYSDLLDDIKNMINKEFQKEEAKEILDKIFYKNSEDLFFKKTDIKEKSSHKNNTKKFNKVIILLTVVIATLTAVSLILKNQNVNTNDNK